MKLTVNTKELKKALELHKKIKSKATPILNGIRLKEQSDNSTLELYNTDLEFSLKSTIEAVVDTPGEALIPLKNLENIVKNTDAKEISLELLDDKVKLGAVSLNTLSLEEFPIYPEVTGKSTIVDSELFFNALTKLYDCVSRDETRNPILAGYCLNTKDNEIVATDSYRLGVAKFAFPDTIEMETGGNLIIPLKVYDILKKVPREVMTITTDKEAIAFKVGNIELITRLLSGKFPSYQQLIPENQDINFEFEPEDLIKQLVKVEKVLFLNEYGMTVKLTFETNSIKVSAEVKEIGSYEDQIVAVGTVETPEKSVQIAFNPSFMVQILKQFEGRVNLGITDELRPVIIKQTEELKFLLMPIRIS